MSYTLITPPTEPVSLAEVKVHSRISHDDEDSYLNLLISAARLYAEHYCQTAIGEQTRLFAGAGFPCQLAGVPVVSVDWVKVYLDGSLTTWDSSRYWVSERGITPTTVYPDTDDRPDAVQIRYVCGRPASESIKLACLIMVAHWYEVREPVVTGTIVSEVPWSAHALLDRERWGDYS